MRVAALSVLVTLAVVGSSCATETGEADEGATATGRAAEEPADADARAGAGPGSVVEADPADTEPAAEVDIGGFSFAPEVIEIQVGDTVRWTNGDETRHTVTAGADAEPTGAFHLAFADRGDSAALAFTEPGEYRYFCTPHPFMQGTVTVAG